MWKQNQAVSKFVYSEKTETALFLGANQPTARNFKLHRYGTASAYMPTG